MRVFRNGLVTGLILQAAIGPVFFYIINLTLQKTLFDGLIAAVGVMLGDYFYITLSILGVSKLLENKKVERVFAIISSIVLAIFGTYMLIIGLQAAQPAAAIVTTPSLFSSFLSTFLLTVSGPISMVLFTSVFTAKAMEFNYTEKDLAKFGLGVGFATFVFMASSSAVFSLIKGSVPILLIQILNLLVGCLLIGYGAVRLAKILRSSK